MGAGLVSSLNRPTGNVTGIAFMFTLLGAKNLELLRELVPKVAVIGGLVNPSNPNAGPQLRDLQAAARTLGQELVVFGASSEREIDNSFAMLAQRHIAALVVTADGFLIGRQDQLVALAARYTVPTIYPLSQYVAAGGLMSYGANLSDALRQTGIYVGRILKGAKPAGLPVLQSATRAGDQSEDREGARTDDATVAAAARRRGNPIMYCALIAAFAPSPRSIWPPRKRIDVHLEVSGAAAVRRAPDVVSGVIPFLRLHGANAVGKPGEFGNKRGSSVSARFAISR
jgi:hypothetical protein